MAQVALGKQQVGKQGINSLYTELCTRKDTAKARFICNNFYNTCSVSALLRELQLPRLELRRQYNHTVLMYMIVLGLINVPIHSSLLTPVSVNTRGHFKDSVNYLQEFCVFYHSFFPAAIKIWNSLPSSIVNCNTVEHFKFELHTHMCINNS